MQVEPLEIEQEHRVGALVRVVAGQEIGDEASDGQRLAHPPGALDEDRLALLGAQPPLDRQGREEALAPDEARQLVAAERVEEIAAEQLGADLADIDRLAAPQRVRPNRRLAQRLELLAAGWLEIDRPRFEQRFETGLGQRRCALLAQTALRNIGAGLAQDRQSRWPRQCDRVAAVGGQCRRAQRFEVDHRIHRREHVVLRCGPVAGDPGFEQRRRHAAFLHRGGDQKIASGAGMAEPLADVGDHGAPTSMRSSVSRAESSAPHSKGGQPWSSATIVATRAASAASASGALPMPLM